MIEHAAYFKSYRQRLGLPNQTAAKDFLGAKNIKPSIDLAYIYALNARLHEIYAKINHTVHESVSNQDIELFCRQNLYLPFEAMHEAGILPKLNNQGRRPEEVLFSWLRGYAAAEYFQPVLARIFNAEAGNTRKIGQDDFSSLELFKRGARADIEIKHAEGCCRVEIQSGFQGINDIKEHKVREARNVFFEQQIPTYCFHVDLYNGQAALVRLDTIESNDMNWVTRQQMEGQTVFSIDQNYFSWRLLDAPPPLADWNVDL